MQRSGRLQNGAMPDKRNLDKNGSERDLRNSVVHRKVAGGFRSDWAPKTFATIRTVVETAKKGQRVLDTLLGNIGHVLPAEIIPPRARGS